METNGKKMSILEPIIVEYVWISGADTHHDIRSKCKTVELPMGSKLTLADVPVWNFDGSSTAQAKAGEDTEIHIRPMSIFTHPFVTMDTLGVRGYVALCECFLSNGQPTPDNTRYIARTVMDHPQAKDLEPWFGLEQEWVLLQNGRPYQWPSNGFPPPQGPYYCSSGPVAYGRDYVMRHYAMCLRMGLKVSGTNAEVLPSQWEWQCGPCTGIEAGDHLVLSRWVMLRILEGEQGLDCSYEVKPVKGDWNGTGMHCNFSTAAMRAEGGLSVIEAAVKNLSSTVAQDIRFYSTHNNERLTGAHETSRYDQFSHGVGTRHTSIRVPNAVAQSKRGYLEDRRPGGDADPYLVSARLFASACSIPAPKLDEIAPRYRRDWMPKVPADKQH